ncbi:Putative niacin/nicotinamide transporter NaiP (plasmid) [Caballeronia sp. SBC1]|uniref:MFS transporter n=1 Tax=unclassified Caballeronia TaxID=2646786 RepID=UPI0013E0F7E0|nr:MULTISPECIES: MFS transporter [unclassified Caballeronia]QIE26137.1 Putative niacin/nicotinamide transporter NaiP [Caballeronia sp. SBC2]QIN64550.1 Putative niacin/nicotinamide transporter NaiP [Caballeronia sp. SBC1]
MFSWYRQVSKGERYTFWACFGGWALDALDVQMFSLVIPAIIAEWGISKTQAGLVSGVTLVASALGGWICGAAADRYGRVKTLQVTVVFFSVFTLLSAFAQNYPQFIVLKALQGFGFGGEWAAGAVLMAETIRNEHRGKAMGAVQSAWAVGWAAAVLLYATVFSFMSPDIGWRVMFGIGILPALLIIYIRRNVKEPAAPARKEAVLKDGKERTPLLSIFAPDVIRMTLIGGVLGVGAHGGYSALTTWLPTYLKTERHLSVLSTGGYLAVIIAAFFFGCLAASQLLDRIGRRQTILLFSVCCVGTVIVYLFVPLSNHAMLALGFPLGFFAAGIPASMGALFNELYPRGTRGTGVGFCYNFGRVVSAGFPVMVGHLAAKYSLGFAIGVDAVFAYAIVAVSVMMLPETRGRTLAEDVPA